MVVKVTNNDLAEAKNKELAVVDFSATWCGPCKMLAPVLDEVAEELADSASFYNVDVDENPDLASEFGVMNIPTILVLKKGEIANKQVGFVPKEQLIELVK